MTLGLVWAQARGGVIGHDGAMPWHVPEDLAHFREVTREHPVLMGRATWDSLPDRFRPLPGRDNLVLTRTPGWAAPGAVVVRDLADAEAALAGRDAWVIGGAQVYALLVDRADRLEVTEIDLDVPGDAFAPAVDPAVWTADAGAPSEWRRSRTGPRYRFVRYLRTGDPAPRIPAADAPAPPARPRTDAGRTGPGR
ncbi:dihydrofolate reductase [Cellulomonas aerilata]|uniref:Dihydrofolate reductase n=1 Tax=Cellulomonas aerilata TaxID=515326 RepID=A0A512DGK6_9CELL|nr:dihydrofolate reductase [Cellulomonas aerilata]GEO35611.1 dihydrofolate reductase [Cellulomonas aerilata]